jgi:anthranilate synthase/aminodeoxychorismate synthase-like glutamine amidotransferase
VARNDAIDCDGIAALGPEAIVVSPGPGTPAEAGVSMAAIGRFSGVIPILGVCLGHQAIGQVFGARIVRAPSLMHGKTSAVRHDGRTIFGGLPDPIEATRYHSLVVDPASVPATLEVTASTDDGVIMGLRHRQHPTEGVQFHPESILTASGHDLLANFLRGLPATGGNGSP